MDVFLAIVAILCSIIGVLGSVIPILPGPMLSFVGMLLCSWADFSTISSGRLWVWGIMSVVISIVDYFLPGYFSKMLGGSRAGVIGATVGVFVGMFIGPVGIIAGPFVGAVAGELLNNRDNTEQAIKVGFGSLLSFIAGSGVKIIISAFMLYYIWRDVWHALWA